MNAIAIEAAEPLTTGTAAPPAHDSASAVGSLRPHMRDASLLVATLSAGGSATDPVALREHSQTLLDEFAAALTRSGIAPQLRKDAELALCALLDETALHYLETPDRAGWEQSPLQVQRFGIHDAGERVFDRLEAYLADPALNPDVLEFYSAILGLGFMGRYALLGETKRRELLADLNNRIAAIRPQMEPAFVIERTSRRLIDGFYRLSPWAMAGMACLVAALVWGVWSAALGVQLSHVTAAQSNAAPQATATKP